MIALARATERHDVGALFVAEQGEGGGVHITQVCAHRGRVMGKYRKGSPRVSPEGDVEARLPDWQPGTLTVDIPI